MATKFILTRRFNEDQARLGAYNRRVIGLREVPIAAITGTVGRPALCNPRRMRSWQKTARYRHLLSIVEAGGSLPPVTLSLLDGHYYLQDGHHRTAIARHLGVLEVDADVTEFLPAAPAPAAWHRAHAAFARDTGLTGLHLRRLEGYEWLRRQIAEHGWYLGERGSPPQSFAAASADWERAIYQPVLADLTRYGVPGRVPELTLTELYLAVCDHKWYRGERLDRDIGFAAAVADYAHRQRHPWLMRLGDRLARDWATIIARGYQPLTT